ncbi:MAG: chemotaxis protein CheR [Rhodocyclales bacterium]|nr:chemotaxis protein CheR [Rhodocyclales bacterium]
MNKPFRLEGDLHWGAIAELLAARLGLHFPPECRPELTRRLAAAAPALGYANATACAEGLLSGSLGHREMEVLAGHLTVGESYFFRDPELFAALAQQVLPELIRQRRETTRRIRVWSAGCSSGEEAYSIAMLLAALLPDREQWQLSVLATDINPQALAIGREGVYGRWSFRSPLPESAQRWLADRPGGRREVAAEIKAMVDFAWLNLIEDRYPSLDTNTNAMDLVLCRNVLMYFQPQRVPGVVERLAACLLDGGWLAVSPVENSLVAVPSLAAQRFPDHLLYRKTSAAPPEVAPMTWLPLPAEASEEHVSAAAIADRPPPPEIAEPTAGGAILQARQLANAGRLAEALACCERTIAGNPLDPLAPYLRASILVELGDTEAAAIALRRCLYLDQDFVMAHFALANLLRSRGRCKEARRHYRNALELLAGRDPAEALADADGITAGRLGEIVRSALDEEAVQ